MEPALRSQFEMTDREMSSSTSRSLRFLLDPKPQLNGRTDELTDILAIGNHDLDIINITGKGKKALSKINSEHTETTTCAIIIASTKKHRPVTISSLTDIQPCIEAIIQQEVCLHYSEVARAECNTSSRYFSAAAYCLFLSSIAKAAKALSCIYTYLIICNLSRYKTKFDHRTKVEKYRRQVLVASQSIKNGLCLLL